MIEQKIKEIKKRLEWREREERKRNVVIWRVEADKGDVRGFVEKIMKEIGTNVRIKEIREIGGKQEERRQAGSNIGEYRAKKGADKEKEKVEGEGRKD